MPTPRHLLSVSLASLLISACFNVSAAEPAWVTKSNANAKLLLDVGAKYDPESASERGVDGYDEQISDFSRDQFEPATRDRRAVVAELERRLKNETDPKIKQDLQILINSAHDQLQTQALERKYFMPFVDLSLMVFSVVQQSLDPRIPKARQQALLVRLNKYAGLAKGYRPITALAEERLQERLKANPKLLGPYKGEVEQAINAGPTMIAGIKDLLSKSSLQGWEPAYAALESQLTAYNARLTSQMLPRARQDHRLPAEVYANNLHQFGGRHHAAGDDGARADLVLGNPQPDEHHRRADRARAQAARCRLPRRHARAQAAADPGREGDAAVR